VKKPMSVPWAYVYDGSSEWSIGPKDDPQADDGVSITIWSHDDDMATSTAAFIVEAANNYDRLRAENEELAFQLDIALKTLGELRQGFEQELSGDTCQNIDKIIAKGEQALKSAEAKK